MEINEIIMEGEGCCLLCLELKQEFVGAVFINSIVQCNININHLIEKYLWAMKNITPTSWLCVNCWTELYDFHNFYIRIKKAHGNLEVVSTQMDENAVDTIGKDATDLKVSPIEVQLDCPVDDINENGSISSDEYKDGIESYIELKETLSEPILECQASEINGSVACNEHNPLLDVEINGSFVDIHSLKEKSQLGKAKLNKTNNIKVKQQRTCRIKSCYATKYLKDSTNKIKVSKKAKGKKIPNKEIKSKIIGNANSATKQNFPVLTESEETQFTSPNANDSKIENDSEMKSNIKQKSKTKTIHNEKDTFLAENLKMKCFLCDIPFETFGNVLKHFKERHKENGYILCCDKKFYRRNALIDHVNYHLNPNYFKCNQCDKVVEDRRRLELHCKSHEFNNGKNFSCTTCGKAFIKLAMLNSHKKKHLSEEEKRFSCNECGKKFASNYMLTNHCRGTHLKMYHKICEICGKSIQDKTIFERHMLQHEGKSAPSASCDICGLLLTDEKALERHKKVIHPENGQKVYTCSICSKISPNLRTHKLHVRFTHESGYNYKCNLCDKAFKRAQPLKEHMASHTGEILYTCPWCPKTFNSNANMHNHRKKIHPKEWEETSRKRYSGKLPPRFKPPTTIEHTVTTAP